LTAVLVTRPQPRAEALCRRLRAAGFRALAQPLLAVEPIADLAPAGAAGDYDDLLFVSANAVRFGLRVLGGDRVRWPVHTRCFAIGQRTADALRVCGAAVCTPGEDMRSEALLALPALQQVTGRRILLVRGEGGRTLLADTLRARGALLEELVCYRRRPVPVDAAALCERIGQEQVRVILISSGEAMGYLSRLLNPQENTNLARTELTVIVPSERVAELAKSAGWEAVHVAANASDDAMLAALRRVA
jgi:uroporphyrinogen-III synthase